VIDTAAPTVARRAPRRPPVWALLPLAAVVWWLVGFLPWILDSLVWPAPFADAPSGPLRAIPLVAGSLGVLVLGALTGGIAAGLLCLCAPRAGRGKAAVFTFAGLALGVVVVLVQAAGTLRDVGGIDGDSRAVVGLSVVTVLTAVTGWLLGSAAVFGRPGAGVALGALSAVVPGWLSSLAFVFVDRNQEYLLGPGWASFTGWVGAAVLGLALVTVGVRPPSRWAWWPLIVLLAWFIGPALTATGYVEVYLRGGIDVPRMLADALAAAWQVFGQASLPANRDLLPWLCAILAAAVVAAALPRVTRQRPQEASSRAS
jgi:hypothetical protein